ncbi:hypothetical protein GCM10009114_27930 [Aliiglaciecola litoralis]|uniref:Uncharacterized protein n=1 Tax=Aliiglaciecola litoralis TaxID=582857 RepID=A0ABN1LNW2_9ALTE
MNAIAANTTFGQRRFWKNNKAEMVIHKKQKAVLNCMGTDVGVSCTRAGIFANQPSIVEAASVRVIPKAK